MVLLRKCEVCTSVPGCRTVCTRQVFIQCGGLRKLSLHDDESETMAGKCSPASHLGKAMPAFGVWRLEPGARSWDKQGGFGGAVRRWGLQHTREVAMGCMHTAFSPAGSR
jgi:hypothetical protein